MNSAALPPAQPIAQTTAQDKESTLRRRQFLKKHNHCGLCGSVLQFHHRTDFSKNVVHEKANCAECRVHSRVIEGSLH